MPVNAPRRPANASGRPAKRSFTIRGHATSISLEAAFWDALQVAATEEGLSVASLVAEIDAARSGEGLSGAVRVWLLARAMARAGGNGA